jgi:hypothetical protein
MGNILSVRAGGAADGGRGARAYFSLRMKRAAAHGRIGSDRVEPAELGDRGGSPRREEAWIDLCSATTSEPAGRTTRSGPEAPATPDEGRAGDPIT